VRVGIKKDQVPVIVRHSKSLVPINFHFIITAVQLELGTDGPGGDPNAADNVVDTASVERLLGKLKGYFKVLHVLL
jgi:hypothetical protein